MIARVETIEIKPHPAQLVIAVSLERLLRFIRGAMPSFLGEARGIADRDRYGAMQASDTSAVLRTALIAGQAP